MSAQDTTSPTSGASSVDRIRDALDAAGRRYKQLGHHIQASCPGSSHQHGDRNPSLSIDYDPAQGRTTLHCFGGDDAAEIVDLLGLDMAMLYDDWLSPDEFKRRRGTKVARTTPRPATKTPQPPKMRRGPMPKDLVKPLDVRPRGKWEIVAVWDFHYPDGTLAQQEVKRLREVDVINHQTGEIATQKEKWFKPQWPDGQGGWITKEAPLNYVSPLYCAPQIAGWVEAGTTIHVAEGPKDADALAAAGCAATSNASGAGSFKEHHADALAGADVVAWIDHDKAGFRRGLDLHHLLTDKAKSLRLVLPAVDHSGADAADHLAAGYGIEDAIEVTHERLAAVVDVIKVEEYARDAAKAEREARARIATGKDEDQAHAGRWAAKSGQALDQVIKQARRAAKNPHTDEGLTNRVDAAIASTRKASRAAHTIAKVDLDKYTEALMVDHAPEEPLDEEVPDNLIDHPTAKTTPTKFVMDHGQWGFSTGDVGRLPRGVYRGYDVAVTHPETGKKKHEQRWEMVAPLPYVHAKVQQVDGEGDPTGTQYLISANPDEAPVSIGFDELRNYSWINQLGLHVPFADKIMRAASTALSLHAEDAPVHCATPQVDDDGRIHLPKKMPVGYLKTSDVPREQALTDWKYIVKLAAQNPRLALVLGASAAAPFLAGLGNQPHVVHMHGEAQAGKTTTITLGAGLWGYPGTDSKIGTRLAWNSTSIAVPSLLGTLAIMPAFFDEIGQAGDRSDTEWHQMISNIAQGAFRLRSTRTGGINVSLPWRGIFFSSGNAAMTGGEATGRHAGTPRRIIELPVPFTNSEAHNDALAALVERAYGHLGHELIDRYTTDAVRPLMAAANESLAELYETKHHSAIGKHLALHLAGAQMLDAICGTEGLLTRAAMLAATDVLDECEPPKDDAQHVLDELVDSLAREPDMWPSKAVYKEHLAAYTVGDYENPNGRQSRLRGTLKGLRWEDGGYTYVGVFSHAWKRLCAELHVEGREACRELDRRGLIRRPLRQRATNIYQAAEFVSGARVYQIQLPNPAADDDLIEPEGGEIGPEGAEIAPIDGELGQNGAELAPETSSEPSNYGQEAGINTPEMTTLQVSSPLIAGGIAGTSPSLTSGIAGIAGIAGASLTRVPARGINYPPPENEKQPPAPCVTCGEDSVLWHQGQPLHPTCEPPTPPSEATPEALGGRASPEEPQTPPLTPKDAQAASGPSHQPRGRRDRKAVRVAGMDVEASEIREAQRWVESIGDEVTEDQASATVARFHQVTGCRWKGPHGTIWALLTGHTKWPGAKSPEPADLGLLEELKASDQFWSARSWILTPGSPAPDTCVLELDVNAQYVASGSSVELGEGNPVHYEDGDTLPENVLKMPGWVRLRNAVDKAPHGFNLPAAMWVPTPIVVYLTRDHKLDLDVSEALVWERRRKALSTLSTHFRNWSIELKPATDPASMYALGMVKTLYTKALGGYLASEIEGLTPPEWHRPDWAMLLRAQAEANMLRGLDRLPAGCTPRAKYADAAYLEVGPATVDAWKAAAAAMSEGKWSSEHAEAVHWDRLDPIQPGRWKIIGHPVASAAFHDLSTAEGWRSTYEREQSATP